MTPEALPTLSSSTQWWVISALSVVIVALGLLLPVVAIARARERRRSAELRGRADAAEAHTAELLDEMREWRRADLRPSGCAAATPVTSSSDPSASPDPRQEAVALEIAFLRNGWITFSHHLSPHESERLLSERLPDLLTAIRSGVIPTPLAPALTFEATRLTSPDEVARPAAAPADQLMPETVLARPAPSTRPAAGPISPHSEGPRHSVPDTRPDEAGQWGEVSHNQVDENEARRNRQPRTGSVGQYPRPRPTQNLTTVAAP